MGRFATSRFGRSTIMLPRLWRSLSAELSLELMKALALLSAGTAGAFVMYKSWQGQIFRPPRICPDKVKLNWTVPGLLNSGSNCFLNAVLQALSSSEIFLKYMDDCTALANGVDCQSRTVGQNEDKVDMPLAVSLSSLLKDLSQLDHVQRVSSARRVMLALRIYVRHFDLGCQQDAGEALSYLASGLEDERAEYFKWLRPTLQSLFKAPHPQASLLEEWSCGRAYREEDELLQLWRGHLSWPLEGSLASLLTCKKCGYQASGCSLENCLSLFTRPEWMENILCSNCSHKAALFTLNWNSRNLSYSQLTSGLPDDQKVFKHPSVSKIKDVEVCGCDDDSCNCEVITKEEGGVWKNVYANATKQLMIGRLPRVLCFQIQRVRLSQDGTSRKLTGHVGFPKILDMFPYTLAARNAHESKRRTSILTESWIQRGPSSGVVPNIGHSNLVELGWKGKADCVHQTAEELSVVQSSRIGEENDNRTAAVSSSGEEHVYDPLLRSGEGNRFQSGSRDLVAEHSKEPIWHPLEYTSREAMRLLCNSLGYSQVVPHYLCSKRTESSYPSPGMAVDARAGSSEQNKTRLITSSVPGNSRRLLYELVSVVVHLGNAQYGHYLVYRMVRLHKEAISTEFGETSSAIDQCGDSQQRERFSSFEAASTNIVNKSLEDSLRSGTLTSNPNQSYLVDAGNRQETRVPVTSEEIHRSDQVDSHTSSDASLRSTSAVLFDKKENTSEMSLRSQDAVDVWFRISDENVQRVEEEEVYGAQASLLFYEQM